MNPRNNILDITNPDVAAQTDSFSSRTITALNDALTIDANGKSTLAVQLFGAFTGTLQVQGSVDGTNFVAMSGTPLLSVGAGTYSATITAAGMFQVDIAGFSSVKIICTAYTSGTPTLSARASMADGMLGLDAPLPAGTNSIGAVTATSTPATGTSYNLLTAATTNAASVKASAGTLFEITIANPTATAAYVKLYNKASAPTVGTDTPVFTIAIPATAAGVGEKHFNFGAIGKRFSTGIAIAVTAAAASTDTAATVAGIQINGTYI